MRGETSREGKHRKITLLGRMRGGSAQQPAQPSADDIVAQVAAASDNLQDLGLDDMQEPIDDDTVMDTSHMKAEAGELGRDVVLRDGEMLKDAWDDASLNDWAFPSTHVKWGGRLGSGGAVLSAVECFEVTCEIRSTNYDTTIRATK